MGMRCRAECTFETRIKEQEYDRGCGCGEGTGCLDIDCKLGGWSDWSGCKNDDGKQLQCSPDEPIQHGEKKRTRKITQKPQNDGNQCGALEETQACNTHNCSADCEMSAWTKWTQCSKRCGGGSKQRTRTIKQHPIGENAKACPTNVEETKTCNDFDCFHYTIDGDTGLEQVKIEDQTITLKNKKQRSTNTLELTIEVLAELDTSNLEDTNNEDIEAWIMLLQLSGPKVTFGLAENPAKEMTVASTIYNDKWQAWKCDQIDENSSCEKVRKGKFNWAGKYTVTFEDYSDSCCTKSTASCQACQRDMTVEEVCAQVDTSSGDMLKGCEDILCCEEKKAECIACRSNMSKGELCGLVALAGEQLAGC